MFIKILFNYQGKLLGQMNLGRTDPGWMCSKGERTRYEKITLLNSQPCLLMDQNKMSNLYRGPSIDASYQVLYHLAKRLQRKSCFRNRPIRNKNCLWWPCLLTDQNGMSNSHRGPSIDASYHVSVHLAKLLQSRRFLEIDQSETRIACGSHVC